MDYVFDFVRLLGSGSPNRRGRRRGGTGFGLQLRLVVYGLLFGMMMPVIRQIDWSATLPPGLKVEWPSGFKVEWPAGHLRLPGGWARGPGAAPDALPGAAPGGGGTIASARFTTCGSGPRSGRATDCVVDGDTFWMAGEKIRIADIDTPETHPPRCAAEARAGKAATERMRVLLNEGPVMLEPYKRGHDRYGRRLVVVTRDGVSLGERLVAEGLARRYDGGHRRGWCGWA